MMVGDYLKIKHGSAYLPAQIVSQVSVQMFYVTLVLFGLFVLCYLLTVSLLLTGQH